MKLLDSKFLSIALAFAVGTSLAVFSCSKKDDAGDEKAAEATGTGAGAGADGTTDSTPAAGVVMLLNADCGDAPCI